MKVLYCTSEAQPFAASGGLADVAGSLPKALRQRFVGCRVVMPLYQCVSAELRENMRFVAGISVPVSWRRQYCGIFEARHNGVIYYLLDNEYYFNRDGLYGYYDDAERFAFFSRAVLEIIPYIDYRPDIIHCNDWQTALVPVYYDAYYANTDSYKEIKTVFTIHNIQYQGKYGHEVLDEVVGIPEQFHSRLEFDDCVNFMKGGIETAHKVTTVSPTYEKEILNPWFSHGLHTILDQRQWKLQGILNGIDTDEYDPAKDTQIYANFTVDDLTGKAENKASLQERLFLDKNPDVPIISMVTRLVEHKGLDLVLTIATRILNNYPDAQFVVLGSGECKYEDFFRYLQDQYPGRVSFCVGYVPELARKIYAGSDIFLMPSKSEPCGLSQMIALRYGTIPVVRETGGLNDSISDSGDGVGNGFRFSTYNAEDLYHAVERALTGYADKDGWGMLVKRAMESDNSWKKSAAEYISMYRTL